MAQQRKFKTEKPGRAELERLLRFKPPEEPVGPPSQFVSTERLKLAGLRMEVEEILSTSCGEDKTAHLARLGPETATVLIKIARSRQECDGRCNLRSAAIAALGRFQHSAAPDVLISIMDDSSEEVGIRAQAAVSAGRLGTPSCVAKLQSALTSDKSEVVRQAAARGLGESGSLEGLRALEQATESDGDAGVKWLAYASLRALEKRYGQKLSGIKAPTLPKRGAPTQDMPAVVNDSPKKTRKAGKS